MERVAAAVHGRNEHPGVVCRRRLPQRHAEARGIRDRRWRIRCHSGPHILWSATSRSNDDGTGRVTGTRISYEDGNQPLEGYLSACNHRQEHPGVLVVPTWLNVDQSICNRADRIAASGYTVLVADLFGA